MSRKRKATRPFHHRRLAMESLEQRTMMAGDVTVEMRGRELFVDGKEGDDSVHVEQQADGRFDVKGKDGTRINGVANGRFTATNVEAITVRLQEGNDQVTIDKVGNLPASVGRVKVTLNAGDDQATLRLKSAVAEVYTGNFDDLRNTVTIEGGGEKNRARIDRLKIEAKGTVTVRDTVAVDGDFQVDGNLRVRRSYFRDALHISGGVGRDTVDLESVIVYDEHRSSNSLRGLRIQTRGDNDVVRLASVTVHSGMYIHAGGGNDRVELEGVKSYNDINVYLGDGNDLLVAKNVDAAMALFDGGRDFDTFIGKGLRIPPGKLKLYYFEPVPTPPNTTPIQPLGTTPTR